MITKLKLTVLLFTIHLSLTAQDILVTTAGDTIECKIVSRSHEEISYKTIQNGFAVIENRPMSEVKRIFRDDYDVVRNSRPPLPSILAGVGGGVGYRTAEIADDLPPQLKDAIKELLYGLNLRADGYYFFHRFMGVGIYANYFNAKAKTEMYSFRDQIWYVGPSFAARFANRANTRTIMVNASIGYMHYKSQDLYSAVTHYMTGETAGGLVAGSIFFPIDPNVSLGIELSVQSGVLMSMTEFYGSESEKIDLKDTPENLSRINLSLIMRFNN